MLLEDHLPPIEPSARTALNPALLELFRVDAEGQLQVLGSGVLALRRRSLGSEQLDSCVCAANSLRDAAGMVGLRLGATVAGALEDCFIALQRRRILPRPPTIDVMTRGYDLLARIARSRDANAAQWTASQHPQVDAFVGEARTLCLGRDPFSAATVVPAGLSTPAPRPPMASSVIAAPAPKPLPTIATPPAIPPPPAARPAAVVVPLPTKPAASAAAKAGAAAADPRARFCREAEERAENLTTDLLELQPDPSDRRLLDACAQQARALVAGAQDIELTPGAILAQELEDCFAAAHRGQLRLRPTAIDVLLHGVNLFLRLAQGLRDSARLDDKQPELRLFLAAVRSIRDAGEDLSAPIEAPAVAAPAAAPPVAVEPLRVELPPELAGPVPAPPAPVAPTPEWDVVAESIAASSAPAPAPAAPVADDAEPPTEMLVLTKTLAELQAEAAAADPTDDQVTEIVHLRPMAELMAMASAPTLPPAEIHPRDNPHGPFEAKLELDSDATLLELFQIEAERLLADLASALLALQRNPTAPELLEPCMRACQSLKGATRMIGLPVGVSLSHALLEVFMWAQAGRITLQQSGIGLLLQSADVLASIARRPEAEFGRWGSELGAEIEVFLAALKRLRDGANDIDPAAALGVTPEAVHAAHAQTQADAQPVAAPTLADADRLTLLELFHGEGDALAQALQTGLAALQIDPLAPEHLEACMRAAHSFKGASRIVGLNMGVSLARALEECFVAAQHGRITLRPSSLTVLQRGADLLSRMVRTEEADFGQWAGKRRAEVELIVAGLKRVAQQANTSDHLLTRVRASLARAV